jgi:hypothetical protein
MVVGSIGRVARLLTKHQVAPVMMLAICVNVPDPSRRVTGYGGVLPVPASSATAPATTAPTAHIDPVVEQQHRDARAVRGRVLYAAGSTHAQPQAPKTAPKAPCPMQRVVQGRAAIVSPTS